MSPIHPSERSPAPARSGGTLELAQIRLGHASWAQELLLSYLKRLPLVRMPLLSVQTFSRDRVAATLAPGGVRGLLYQAAGGDLLGHVDVAAYLRQVMALPPPRWAAFLSTSGRDGPNVLQRVREIYRARFFELGRDLARFEAAAPPALDPGLARGTGPGKG